MRFPALILSLVAGLAAAAPPEGIVFNQRYKAGQRYHQTMTMKQEMQMDMGGKQKLTRETSTTMGMSATATAHENKRDKRVAVKYDSVKASITGEGQNFTFDSTKPDAIEAGPLGAYSKVIGQEFKVIFNEDEDVTEVENLETALANLSGADPNSSQLYRELFNREAVKRMMQQATLRSPRGRLLKPGGSWPFSQELTLPNIGKLTIRGFYTFAGMVERNGVQCAEVKAAAEITIDTAGGEATDDETVTRIQKMQLKIEDGKMEGTLYYDPEIDFTRQADVVQKITLTGKMPDGSGRALRMPMKQTIAMVLDGYEAVK